MADSIQIVAGAPEGGICGAFFIALPEAWRRRRRSLTWILFGIGGVITYKNTHLREVGKALSLDHIVLETDAPYLTPVPFRGKKEREQLFKICGGKDCGGKRNRGRRGGKHNYGQCKKIFGA